MRSASRSLALFAFALTSALLVRAAELRVGGMGPFGSREATRNLQVLFAGPLHASVVDASTVEDASLILLHQLQQDGYLDARLTAEITHSDGRKSSFPITAELDPPLPRPLDARTVVFRVQRGTRFLIDEISFHGLTAMKPSAARGFFTGETMLIPLAADRVYSSSGVRNAVTNLQQELQLRGFADAAVTLTEEKIDRASGRVRLAVDVREGPVWRVDALRFVGRAEPMPPDDILRDRVGQAWSSLWRQDATAQLRKWYYEHGYPDARIEVMPRTADRARDRQSVTVEIRLHPGKQFHLGAVRLAGNTHTRASTMNRMLRLHAGDLLNPIEIDNAQARLAQLGVFSRIDVTYEDAAPDVRDAVFTVKEGRLQEVNLLAGYGSYEQLRGGIEWQQFNLWGRAHTSNLRLVQSMKSTSGDYRYTVPSLFGTTLDGSARLFGLRRDELSFRREEFGANLSLSRLFRSAHTTATAAYTFRRLRSTHNELATRSADQAQADVASLDLRLVQDRRDNPLEPRSGRRLFAQVELASKTLGGEVNYQQFQVGASWHHSAGPGRWVHLGLEHAVVTTFGAKDDRGLPVNVRFFPGGDSSIRGYNRGAAAPRLPNGQFVGAKTFLQFNAELEQAITPKFSAVLFGDALGMAEKLADYPFDQKLYTVGVGVRYHTIIGPLRVEYGRNINPRPLDPHGTLLVSVGFPF